MSASATLLKRLESPGPRPLRRRWEPVFFAKLLLPLAAGLLLGLLSLKAPANARPVMWVFTAPLLAVPLVSAWLQDRRHRFLLENGSLVTAEVYYMMARRGASRSYLVWQQPGHAPGQGWADFNLNLPAGKKVPILVDERDKKILVIGAPVNWELA
jgi:hypothetical protein